MAFSLAILIILGLLANFLFSQIKIPGLVGMLLVGILCGPFALNILDQRLLSISYDLRLIAFIILLLRAGLSLSRKTLNELGIVVFPFGVLPAMIELITVAGLAYVFLGFDRIESLLLGIVLAAVSPAVVVPMMLDFAEKQGQQIKRISSLIIASSSLDNVMILTLFSACIGFYAGEKVNLLFKIMSIPVSVITGLLFGGIFAWILIKLFNQRNIRATKKMLIVLGVAILLSHLEQLMNKHVPFSAILAILGLGCAMLEFSETFAHEISDKLGKLWIFAEIILFVLVGASVNIHVAWNAGLSGLVLITVGLTARSLGTYASLIGSDFSMKEKLFCVVSYIPKATIQALIAGLPLSYGVEHGEEILAMGVLAIVITAPIGAFFIDRIGKNLVELRD